MSVSGKSCAVSGNAYALTATFTFENGYQYTGTFQQDGWNTFMTTISTGGRTYAVNADFDCPPA